MQKNEGSPLRKSVNCAGKWTASDISQKKRAQQQQREKGYRKAAECYPRAEVANVSHTIAQKGAFSSKKRLPHPHCLLPARSKLITFPTAFCSHSPLPLPFNSVSSSGIGFRIPLNSPI